MSTITTTTFVKQLFDILLGRTEPSNKWTGEAGEYLRSMKRVE